MRRLLFNQHLAAYATMMVLANRTSPTDRINGKTPTLVIVDELSHIVRDGEATHAAMDETVRDGKVIVIGSMSMDAPLLTGEVNRLIGVEFISSPYLEVPRSHAPVWPQKEYGKKYRRSLRGGKR